MKDTNYSKHLSVSVAMLYGWLTHKKVCPTCKGSMKIGISTNRQDRLEWRCRGDGPGNSKKRKSYVHNCQIKKSIRADTWLETFRQSLGRILYAIFYWYAGYIPLETISKWTKIKPRQLDRITKCCRLIAANFMVQNPHLIKIGGPKGRDNQPIKVQIDESACGKMKQHRGKKRTQTWCSPFVI